MLRSEDVPPTNSIICSNFTLMIPSNAVRISLYSPSFIFPSFLSVSTFHSFANFASIFVGVVAYIGHCNCILCIAFVCCVVGCVSRHRCIVGASSCSVCSSCGVAYAQSRRMRRVSIWRREA